MNLTIGRTGVSTWKRVKMQYLLAAAGVALAVSGAIAINSRGTSAPAPPAGLVHRSTSTWDLRPVAPQVIYYLAGSPEQAEMVRQGVQIAAAERQNAGMSGPDAQVVVLTPSTEQEVLAIRAAVANTGQENPSGTIYEIIDVRGR